MQAQAAGGQGPTFSEFLWAFVDGKPIVNHPKTLSDVPATTKQSDAMSKALKKKGFKFLIDLSIRFVKFGKNYAAKITILGKISKENGLSFFL